jgi:pyruvate dehydrogenase kinase 2/3/4
MSRMLVSRISRRVLAEHHLALSKSLGTNSLHLPEDPHVGIIYTALNLRHSIDKCVALLRGRPDDIEEGNGESVPNCGWPEVVVDGHVDTKFSYIREHLE